jgi:hypothetical protein
MLRLLPLISRLSELLLNEHQIANPIQRQQIQVLARNVAAALNEVVHATDPAAHLLRDLQIGNSPGDFHLPNVSAGPHPNVQPVPEPEIKLTEQREKEVRERIVKFIKMMQEKMGSLLPNPKSYIVDLIKRLDLVINACIKRTIDIEQENVECQIKGDYWS